MRLSLSMRGLFQAIAIVLSLALPTVLAVSAADARVGGGFSSGSRGSRTYAPPPSTSTSPGAAQPFNRTFTQPSSPSVGTSGGGLFNRPGGLFGGRGGGLLGGLAAGFLGAGLFGMLFGGGLFSGIGSGMGFGLGSGSSTAPLDIQPADYEAFERLLGEIQAAWSNEDIGRLRTLATPEMVSYFEGDLQQNRARNRINKVSGTKLLQGDLAEAWREGETDFASVAMRFSIVDRTLDRTSGQLVEGSEQPTEITEVWTFLRPRGGNWELSAIQQTN
jgi:predicted lipid-binding transport protein (Tim44 family)